MASQYKTADTDHVVEKAVEELKMNQLIPDYAEQEKKIKTILHEAARKEAKLTKQMFHMIDNKTMREVEKEMSPIIGQKRISLIQKSFQFHTLTMKMMFVPYVPPVAKVFRFEDRYQPDIILNSRKEIVNAIMIQMASLMLELFVVALSCAGIEVDLNEAEMRALVQEVEGLVPESAFESIRNKFLEAWNEAAGIVWRKAKAIFNFLKDCYSGNYFWKILKLIFKNMSTWQNSIAIVEVALIIVAAFAIDESPLIARFGLAVDREAYLAEKIANLNRLLKMLEDMDNPIGIYT